MHKESVEVDGNHPDSLNNSPVPSKAAPVINPQSHHFFLNYSKTQWLSKTIE
jgi:hypothetical protein